MLRDPTACCEAEIKSDFEKRKLKVPGHSTILSVVNTFLCFLTSVPETIGNQWNPRYNTVLTQTERHNMVRVVHGFQVVF